MTLCVQYYVVHRRALPLWAELGPDAGRPLRMQFTQSARRVLRHLQRAGRLGHRGGPGGPGTARGRAPGAGDADDPNIIDAEVVEDDDDHGPPELHAPR